MLLTRNRKIMCYHDFFFGLLFNHLVGKEKTFPLIIPSMLNWFLILKTFFFLFPFHTFFFLSICLERLLQIYLICRRIKWTPELVRITICFVIHFILLYGIFFFFRLSFMIYDFVVIRE